MLLHRQRRSNRQLISRRYVIVAIALDLANGAECVPCSSRCYNRTDMICGPFIEPGFCTYSNMSPSYNSYYTNCCFAYSSGACTGDGNCGNVCPTCGTSGNLCQTETVLAGDCFREYLETQFAIATAILVKWC
jgi:hypothetical protein